MKIQPNDPQQTPSTTGLGRVGAPAAGVPAGTPLRSDPDGAGPRSRGPGRAVRAAPASSMRLSPQPTPPRTSGRRRLPRRRPRSTPARTPSTRSSWRAGCSTSARSATAGPAHARVAPPAPTAPDDARLAADPAAWLREVLGGLVEATDAITATVGGRDLGGLTAAVPARGSADERARTGPGRPSTKLRGDRRIRGRPPEIRRAPRADAGERPRNAHLIRARLGARCGRGAPARPPGRTRRRHDDRSVRGAVHAASPRHAGLRRARWSAPSSA